MCRFERKRGVFPNKGQTTLPCRCRTPHPGQNIIIRRQKKIPVNSLLNLKVPLSTAKHLLPLQFLKSSDMPFTQGRGPLSVEGAKKNLCPYHGSARLSRSLNFSGGGGGSVFCHLVCRFFLGRLREDGSCPPHHGPRMCPTT